MKKLAAALFTCFLFLACKKDKSGDLNQYTYPTVSYTLHTESGGQVYDHAHSSVYRPGTTILDSWVYWDNGTAIGSTYACGAGNRGTYYQAHLFDSATGGFFDTRSILSFILPSANSFTNPNDTTVSVNIRDTAYYGHASVSADITSMDNNSYAEPTPTISGSFNIHGTVSNGYTTDSVTFSSSGTFTNMPYR